MDNYVTININPTIFKRMKEQYSEYEVSSKNEYCLFSCSAPDFFLNIYTNNKKQLKAVFNGEESLLEAQKWDKNAKIKEKKQVRYEDFIYFDPQIGSDEVGTGDICLPIIVVASRIDNQDLYRAIKLGIKDSKKLDDLDIEVIGEELSKFIDFSKLTLPNRKYNDLIINKENMNSIKAKMHNRALLNLHDDYEDDKVFIDQFCEKELYYKYLEDEKEVLKNISFSIHGESFFPSVAISSIIARYSLLLEKERLEAKYHLTFPLGAGKKAEAFVKNFISKFGIAEAKKVFKINFKNIADLFVDS